MTFWGMIAREPYFATIWLILTLMCVHGCYVAHVEILTGKTRPKNPDPPFPGGLVT